MQPENARCRATAGDDEAPGASTVSAFVLAPLYVAEDLLRGEGFTEVRYVPPWAKGFYQTLGSGEADIGRRLRHAAHHSSG